MATTGKVRILLDKTELMVDGVKFRWNNAYRVYNSDKDYHQLTWEELRASETKDRHRKPKRRNAKPRLTR